MALPPPTAERAAEQAEHPATEERAEGKKPDAIPVEPTHLSVLSFVTRDNGDNRG